MGRVISNGISLQVAREATLGVLPGSPVWFALEPNSISSFGTTVTKSSRSPITKMRVRRKGAIDDADSPMEFEADVTLTQLRVFAEGFLFARAIGGDAYLPSAATTTVYTVAALSAAQAGRLTYGASAAKSLLYAIGWANSANNGLKVLGASPTTGGTTLTVSGNVAETVAAGQMAEVNVAGVRGAAGDLKINSSGNLTSIVLDFTTLGLGVGQVIHVGGTSVTNQFFNPANIGFTRIAAIAAHTLTLVKRDATFVTDDGTSTGSGGTPLSIDILFGQFVRNVSPDHADYQEISFQFELASPNLLAGNLTGYEYAVGNWADSLSVSIPLGGKATFTLGFVGKTSTVTPTNTRATNAANALYGTQTAAFGSSTDLARMRVQDVDETGLTTDFKSASFTIGNNVQGEKVLGTLGPKYLSAGDLECDVEHQMLFTNAAVVTRIRGNTNVGFDFVLRNGDGAVSFDLPTGTLSGGKRSYPANQSVLMDATFVGHQEDVYGYTCGISFFPVVPAGAVQ
jgi:hypothetical protein